jgi:hypothetical protein
LVLLFLVIVALIAQVATWEEMGKKPLPVSSAAAGLRLSTEKEQQRE